MRQLGVDQAQVERFTGEGEPFHLQAAGDQRLQDVEERPIVEPGIAVTQHSALAVVLDAQCHRSLPL